MKRYILLLVSVLLIGFTAEAQQTPDYRLAQQYFRNGEFEKAAVLYEKLFKQNPTRDYYFDRYIETLLSMEDYKTYEKELKKRIKQYPQKVQLYVKYGTLYERQFETAKADEKYETAINQLPKNRGEIIQLANAYMRLAKYDFALKSYEKGSKLMGDKKMFSYEMANLYRLKGDSKLMIENYLNSLQATPSRLGTLKTIFQRYFGEDDYKELQAQLYARIQEDQKTTAYPELLAWMFIQKKDYKNALRQVRAMDRRLDENGGRVYRLAQIASKDKDYDTAIAAYEYIVEKKGKNNTYYLESKRESLRNKRMKLVSGYDYQKEELMVLEQEYNTFLDEFGRNSSTGSIIFELAELEAFYINDLDKAIGLLEQLLEFGGLRRHLQAKTKLSLGDFYLMSGEIWEATLLYSQVDKAFKDDVIGQTARFKNAKLSYYKGDFEWAQGQFDVLKASTSKLIANDALDLSVFILDNLALDSVTVPMELYAKSDLLVFQNRFDDAFVVLDSIKTLYPNHSLQDDIYYTKANVYIKQRNLEKAITMLQKIITDHPESIRTDNALFMLGDIYEFKLNQPEEAKKYYETIVLDFSNSTFAVEARKRFRRIEGSLQ